VGKFIPVEPEKWAEMVKAMAENARLKAEVERLNTGIQPEGSNDAVGRAVNVLLEKQKEIANLKAEVERLTSDIQMEKENEDRLVREWQKANNEVYGLQRQVAALIDDQTRLKAEVERLRKGDERDMTTAYLYAAEQSKDTIARLKAEVERLTEAGDEMAVCFNCPTCAKNWNAAKEGKQP